MWQSFEDIDPAYSGYAWVQFWKKYGDPVSPEWTHLCRIWSTDTSPNKWWTGWDLDFDDQMSHDYEHKVMLIRKPEMEVVMGNVKAECLSDHCKYFTKGELYRGYIEGDVLITTDNENSKNCLFQNEYRVVEEFK